jgi:hypothetical protein
MAQQQQSSRPAQTGRQERTRGDVPRQPLVVRAEFKDLTNPSKLSDDRINELIAQFSSETRECVSVLHGLECGHVLRDDRKYNALEHPKKPGTYIFGCKTHLETVAKINGNGLVFLVSWGIHLLREELVRREEMERKKLVRIAELDRLIAFGLAVAEEKLVEEITPAQINAWKQSHAEESQKLLQEIGVALERAEAAAAKAATSQQQTPPQPATSDQGGLKYQMQVPMPALRTEETKTEPKTEKVVAPVAAAQPQTTVVPEIVAEPAAIVQQQTPVAEAVAVEQQQAVETVAEAVAEAEVAQPTQQIANVEAAQEPASEQPVAEVVEAASTTDTDNQEDHTTAEPNAQLATAAV